MHEVHLHGEQIRITIVLPIGCLPEEDQEFRNEDDRRYQLTFSGKFSSKHY